jgi:hypothetical protein
MSQRKSKQTKSNRPSMSASARRGTNNNNMQNKRKQNNNNNKKKVVNNSSQAPIVRMSECASNYAKCLANPFTGPIGCLPVSPSVLSYKFRVWSKGTLQTGTTGTGFIYADHRTGAANNIGIAIHSINTYTGTTIAFTGVGTAFVTSNSPFTDAAYGANPASNAFRVVSAGIRVRYIGTELNRGGQIIALADPTGAPMSGLTAAQMLAEPTARKFPVIRSWTTVLWRPTSVQDRNWDTDPGAYDSIGAFGTIGIMVISPGAVEADYEFEVAAVYEVNGRNVRGQTVTPVDTVGQEAVYSASLTSSSIMPHQENQEASAIKFLQEAAHGIGKLNSYMTSAAEVVDKGAQLGGTLFKIGEVAASILM